MSATTRFPVALIASCSVQPGTRVVSDTMEDGTTAVRLLWPVNTFKRTFTLTTPPLTEAEFAWLRSFYRQRSGPYEAFWFRDNINRGGNAEVRFSPTKPINWNVSGLRRVVTIDLVEIAPVAALPEADELAAAAGATPLFWWDADREKCLLDGGTEINDTATFDAAGGGVRATWYGGASGLLGGKTSTHSTYLHQGGAVYAKTASNAALSGAQPAVTVFIVCRAATSATQQVLLSAGAAGSGSAVGLQLTGSNAFAPWVGSTETWTGATQSNGTADTWRSLAAVWAASSDTATLYVNAASVGTASNTRSLTAGPAALNGSPSGTLVTVSGQSAHAIIFPAALTLAQVKAVHNLLATQQGLAAVA